MHWYWLCHGKGNIRDGFQLLASPMQVVCAAGISGTIESSFGKSGKFKVAFDEKLPPISAENSRVTLSFKKYVFDKDKKKIAQ